MKSIDTKERILEFFFDFPSKETHIRELSRILKISPPAILKAVSALQKNNLVVLQKNFLLKIRANRDNPEFINKKRVNNLKNVYESGLFNYLSESFTLSTILLFGSYARGEDNEHSDMDIAILETKKKELDLERFERKLNRKINVEFVSLQKLNKELRNSIISGITLKGYIEIT